MGDFAHLAPLLTSWGLSQSEVEARPCTKDGRREALFPFTSLALPRSAAACLSRCRSHQAAFLGPALTLLTTSPRPLSPVVMAPVLTSPLMPQQFCWFPSPLKMLFSLASLINPHPWVSHLFPARLSCRSVGCQPGAHPGSPSSTCAGWPTAASSRLSLGTGACPWGPGGAGEARSCSFVSWAKAGLSLPAPLSFPPWLPPLPLPSRLCVY